MLLIALGRGASLSHLAFSLQPLAFSLFFYGCARNWYLGGCDLQDLAAGFLAEEPHAFAALRRLAGPCQRPPTGLGSNSVWGWWSMFHRRETWSRGAASSEGK